MNKFPITAHRQRPVGGRADPSGHSRRRPDRPIERRSDGDPTQGRWLHRHRQQSRRGRGRPVHRRRGPSGSDLQPHGFRNTRSPGRRPHHGDGQDRLRRPRVLNRCIRGALLVGATRALSRCRAERQITFSTGSAGSEQQRRTDLHIRRRYPRVPRNRTRRTETINPGQHPDPSSRSCSRSAYQIRFAGHAHPPVEYRRGEPRSTSRPFTWQRRRAPNHATEPARPMAYRGTSTTMAGLPRASPRQ